MALNLTQTAILTKRIIKVFGILIALVITGLLVYRTFYIFVISKFLTPPEEIPNTKFGVLPPPDLPKTLVDSSTLFYTMDTATGALPLIKDKIIKVYFQTKPVITFLSGDRSDNLAKRLNFNNRTDMISDIKYKYQDGYRQLTVDIDTLNFDYNMATPPAKKVLDDIPNEVLISNLKSLLGGAGVFNEGFNKGKSEVNLLKFNDNNLVPALSRSEAQAAELLIWPNDIDDKHIMFSNFKKPLIKAVAVNSARNINEDFISLNFRFWPVDTTILATYPLKSVNDAFENLRTGKATVVVAPPPKMETSITNIYLAYYQSDNYTPYLQPVYVFEGPEFAAYVPAVINQFLGNQQNKTPAGQK